MQGPAIHRREVSLLKTLLNVIRHAARPSHARVIAKKALARISHSPASEASDEARLWAEQRSLDYAEWARQHDAPLWQETLDFADDLKERAAVRLEGAQTQFGGGGAYAFLYFLVRLRKPEYVVETGVAAGWSSAAILAAMERNGRGRLWSSDFPYFRQAGPDDEIGILVPPEHRERWTLLIDGDEQNLPRIMGQVPRIDMLHYDSDKTYKGRSFAVDTARPKLADGALVIFDDIQDNCHFRDIAGSDAKVFKECGKFLGVIERWNRCE